MRRSAQLVRLVVFIATVLASWAILSLGGDSENLAEVAVGTVAARDYEVVNPGPVVDEEAFQAAREDARAGVEPVTVPREEIPNRVLDNIETFFAGIEGTVVADGGTPPGDPTPATTPPTTTPPTTTPEPTTTPPTTTPEPTTTTTTSEEDATPSETTVASTTIPVGEVLVEGFVFVDADGDGEYGPELAEDAPLGAVADVPLPSVGVAMDSPQRSARTETQSDGTFSATVSEGEITVSLDQSDPDYPEFEVSAGEITQTVECSTGQPCMLDPVGLDPGLLPVEAVVTSMGPTLVPDESIAGLAAIAREDVVRTAAGQPSHLAVVQQAAITHANGLLSLEIYDTPVDQGISLEEARIRASEQPPFVYYTDTGQSDQMAGQAAGDIVANFLIPNWTFDDDETAAAAEDAADAVQESDYEVVYFDRQIIANEGDVLNRLEVDAIRLLSGFQNQVQRDWGLMAVLSILGGMLALYLYRFRQEFWSRPRIVALLGILIVLAAGAVRATVLLAPEFSWYVMPAVAFGLMATVLFDARIGMLMALSVAILTAAGTRDPGITVYALMATMAPIGFVSAVSTRRAFRNAAVFAAATSGVIAAATSWFFHTGPDQAPLQSVGTSVLWAFGVSLVAGLVGLALLQFFESAFDITTTLALLDLTDRNHDALQLLQERAFGTFNHSLMVGTLADAAARAIGADPLLARASAYYHDLGKTEQPTMFIENQFGIPNPHDQLTPAESAEVIRRHVTEGVRLAKKFKIPSEVAEAIVSHHGDGIMRFFYEKAREADPDTDPARFRHVGHKPRSAETAIVMLADSLEASCRAVFQNEEPTSDAIEKVVDRVIDEKVNDGQLGDSPLTLAQLTQVRRAFLGSLVGHYHQRIAYPNFPGS